MSLLYFFFFHCPKNVLFKQCTALITKSVVILVVIVLLYFLNILFDVYTRNYGCRYMRSENAYLYFTHTGLFKMIVVVHLSSSNFAPNSGNNHRLTIPFEVGMYSFKIQGACVSRNWRYKSEPPLKPSPLTCWTNSIIVLMFVESQRMHIWSTCKVCNKNLECVLLNKKKHIYCCLKCIAYDKLLKFWQSFWITLYMLGKIRLELCGVFRNSFVA